MLIAGHDPSPDLNIQTATLQSVIHCVAGIFVLSAPQFLERVDHVEHDMLAEDRGEIGDEVVEIVGFVHGERLAIDVDDRHRCRALDDALRVLAQMITKRQHAFGPPGFEQRQQPAAVFEPQRDGRMIEQAAGVILVEEGFALGFFLGGDVDGRDHHRVPVPPRSWQNRSAELEP